MHKEFEKIDHSLLITFVILLLSGFIMIYNSSAVLAYEKFGDSGYYFKRQFLWAIIGITMALALYKVEEKQLKKFIPGFFIFALVLVFVVHVPGMGKNIGGATRWLKLGPLPAFQPFEIAKLAYVLYLAFVLSDARLPSQKKMVRIGIFTTLLCLGLVLQRDFGGTFIVVMIFLFMLFLAGLSLKYYLIMLPAAGVMFALLIISQPYRMKRIFAYLDPWKDYYGAGWQPAQSLTAIGSGGIFGLGLSQSQQKYLYLPTPHTDYIFSIIGEELGLIGALVVVGLFYNILQRGMMISHSAKDKFYKFLAAGLTLMFMVQAFVNIGVATGLLPSKGTTLPFLSAGGSSLVVSIAAAGLLLLVSKKVHGEKR